MQYRDTEGDPQGYATFDGLEGSRDSDDVYEPGWPPKEANTHRTTEEYHSPGDAIREGKTVIIFTDGNHQTHFDPGQTTLIFGNGKRCTVSSRLKLQIRILP